MVLENVLVSVWFKQTWHLNDLTDLSKGYNMPVIRVKYAC